MKKHLTKIVVALAAIILLASCGVTQSLSTNTNLNQTNVVLSQKNFHVVKNVQAEVSATYVLGIGVALIYNTSGINPLFFKFAL